jgi:hypothetical protein
MLSADFTRIQSLSPAYSPREGYGLYRLRKKVLIFLWACRLGAILAVPRGFPFAFCYLFFVLRAV